MLVLYGLAILLSAALLFLVEPMAGKMLLPVLGGAPAVWNTCMVFFQAGLLLGYAYAHVLTRRLGPRVQVAVHGVVVALGVLLLPVGLRSGGPPGEGSPALWTFGALAAAVGAPFLVLSGTGPLLQRWFAMTGHREAEDPYFLYAASNLGSLGGLLAYPLLVEPLLPLGAAGGGTWGWTQSGLWSVGYVAFVLLGGLCAAAMLRGRRGRGDDGEERVRPRGATVSGGAWRERLRWVVYAFVPSSVMLGATQYMTTDLASIPLLWVVPLAIYLLTFALAFARKQWIPLPWSSLGLAVLSVAAAASFWSPQRPPAWLFLLLHPLVVFAASLVGHGRLAAERPLADRLTEYYLMVALGGVLGGVFNALLAPVLFEKVGVVEYPIALVLAALVRPASEGDAGRRRAVARLLDVLLPAAVALAAFGLQAGLAPHRADGDPRVELVQVAVPCLLCLLFLPRPHRFALGLAVLLAAGWIRNARPQEVLYQKRTFYGTHRVLRGFTTPFTVVTPEGEEKLLLAAHNILLHGTTRHGIQLLEPGLRSIPTTYYHPTGPIGEVFRSFGETPRLDRVALVGLGAGTLAAYGRQGERITCYELDPEVVRIARDSGYFTYLRDSKAELDYVVGDGRLSLARAQDAAYGLIVVDAFSSDAIPVHLLTRQAFELYLRKLRPDGLLAVHITNQYLDLEPVVDALVADLGLAGIVKSDGFGSRQELFEAKERSSWALVARDRAALAPVAQGQAWRTLPLAFPSAPRERYLWTDDYSNVLSVLKR